MWRVKGSTHQKLLYRSMKYRFKNINTMRRVIPTIMDGPLDEPLSELFVAVIVNMTSSRSIPA